MAGFADELAKKFKQFEKYLNKSNKKAMRDGLNAGVKEYKGIAKPLIPILGKSTPYRTKGTVQRNLRHRIRVKVETTDKLEGLARIRIRRAGGKKMAAVSSNSKDKSDPFYWFMLDRGTKKMDGIHFIERAKQSGEQRAEQIAKQVYLQTMLSKMGYYR